MPQREGGLSPVFAEVRAAPQQGPATAARNRPRRAAVGAPAARRRGEALGTAYMAIARLHWMAVEVAQCSAGANASLDVRPSRVDARQDHPVARACLAVWLARGAGAP